MPVGGINSGYIPNTGNELCLRFFREDLYSEGLDSKVTTWLSSHNADPSEVHVILDLRIVGSLDQSYIHTYGKIPLLDKWRTITIAGGSFPKDLQGLSVGEHLLPRLEWQRWKEMVGVRPSRIPTFGDYATLHPFLQPAVSGMNPSASIRYTTEDHWLIMRGEGLRNEGGPGHAQYPANAQLLMEHQEFCGREFSFGDKHIYERPINKHKPGIPMNWVTVGVNHHLTFVVRQIASLFDLPLPQRHYRPEETQLPLLHAGTKPPMQPQPRSLGPDKKR